MQHMDRIGVRELRQRASRYPARVAGGETLEVTDRGRAVAHLVPVRADPWDDPITSGRVSPAEDGDDAALEAALAAIRSEER